MITHGTLRWLGIAALYNHQLSIWNFDLCQELSEPLADAFMDFTSGILSVTGINATGHIFASYPARHLSILGGFIDQVNSTHNGPIIVPLIPLRLEIQQNLANVCNVKLIGPFCQITTPTFALLGLGFNDPSHRKVRPTMLNTISSLLNLCTDPKTTC